MIVVCKEWGRAFSRFHGKEVAKDKKKKGGERGGEHILMAAVWSNGVRQFRR
jgi:hypothetical protein